MGVGSLGIPNFDLLSHGNEHRLLSPSLGNKLKMVSPLGYSQGMSNRSTKNKTAALKAKARVMNSTEYNPKFEDLGL